MTRLQVALVAGIDPARTRPGGTRSYVLGLARYLASAGVDVTLVGIGGPPAEEDPFDFVAAIPDPSASSLAFHRGLTRVLRAQKFQAGIVHTQRPDDLVPFLPKFAASGLLITIHGDPLPGIRNRHGRVISAAYRRLERRGISAARRVLFVDSHSRDVFARRYASQSEKFVDSSVGISESKDLEGQLNRSSHRVLGVVPYEKMASLYSAVDATILPSAREAMPLTCVESLACGTPVVATRTGRLSELIEPGRNGFLVSADPIDLARAIDRTVTEGRQMERACRQSAEPFGWDRVGPTILRQYQEARP